MFACNDGNAQCLTLLATYTLASQPLFRIDVPDSKVAGTQSYKIATGSTTLYDGVLQSPGSTGAGATFAPTVSGQDPNSGPAIYLNGTSPVAPSLHGLPIVSPIVIFPQDTSGAEIQLNLKVPIANLVGSATLDVSPTGSEDLRALSLTVPDLSIPGTPIDFGTVSFSFNLDTDEWTGKPASRCQARASPSR
ncbi:MAG: hypothetical protein ACLP01_22840 [Solirubrobacteraceae bacterium]